MLLINEVKLIMKEIPCRSLIYTIDQINKLSNDQLNVLHDYLRELRSDYYNKYPCTDEDDYVPHYVPNKDPINKVITNKSTLVKQINRLCKNKYILLIYTYDQLINMNTNQLRIIYDLLVNYQVDYNKIVRSYKLYNNIHSIFYRNYSMYNAYMKYSKWLVKYIYPN